MCIRDRSLCDNSQYAVHGGATLEEVLVPVIIAKKGKVTAKTFRVKAINLKAVSYTHLEPDAEFPAQAR